jgi:uncharacterized protein YndB with AHSA1/START domain
MTTVTTTERSFTIVRQFDAPRDLVFRAWTDPEHLDRWFAGSAPNELPTTVDLRVGGAWRFHMIENAEKSYVTGGIYREIVAPERLVFTFGAVDGWPPITPGNLEDNPIVTITFDDLNGGTEMALHVGFADHLDMQRIQEWFATGMLDGWTQTLERLDDAKMRTSV